MLEEAQLAVGRADNFAAADAAAELLENRGSLGAAARGVDVLEQLGANFALGKLGRGGRRRLRVETVTGRLFTLANLPKPLLTTELPSLLLLEDAALVAWVRARRGPTRGDGVIAGCFLRVRSGRRVLNLRAAT